MSKILVIAEHLGGKLNPSTARAVSAAAAVKPEAIDVLVLADAPDAIAAEAAKIDGVSRVLTVTRAENAHPLAAVLAPQIAKAAVGYSHVFAPSTTFGKDVAPRVAALLGVAQVSDVMSVEAAASGANSAPIEALSIDVALPTHSRFIELKQGSSDRPDLQSASKVVSGGRGVGSKENFDIIYKFADKIGAAVGASRAAVDAGYVPNEMQVGQTGKIIAPELYMAIGISGAIQHLTGIKDAGTIVAINKDGEAPIFEIADFGLVGDLFKLIPELEQALG